jgi:fucose 4-O-acetylase-like acetyltransferase
MLGDGMRLTAFDYFRGVAILFIVAGHSYGPWVIDSFSEKLLANLITGGTVLFLFISGFFFHHVFYENFNYNKFVVKKSKNVLFPYLILSAFGILLYLVAAKPLPYMDKLISKDVASWYEYIELVGIYLWTGRVATAYWYIPFIFIVFLLSPVFIQYVRLSLTARMGIFFGLLILSTLIQRPVANLSLLHSFIYYIPIYLLGINCSIHRDQVVNFVSGKSMFLGGLVLALAAFQAAFVDGFGYHHKESMLSYEGVDILILQKIVMCFFLLSVFQAYEDRNIPGLKLLAAASFSIYFLHPWLLKFVTNEKFYSLVDFIPGIGVFILTVPLIIVSSMVIAYTARRVLKNHSRYILGW